jgi:very-short-patch-repair endonuclease
MFCDGEKWHSTAEQLAKDKLHNERLQALGWVVKRYRTADITERLAATIDDIYQTACVRVLDLGIE